VGLQGPGRDVGAEPPDVTEQLLAREDAIGIGCELDDERKLLCRQLHLPAEHGDAARAAVDRERADLEQLDARRASPQQRVDACEQLLVDERTRQAIVGAGERADARSRIRAAEHDHRAIRNDAAVEGIGIAEHEHVGIGRARQLLGSFAGDDVEAVVPELALEEAPNGRFRLGEEKRGHGNRG
jgi:hypothetical protein